MCGICGMIKREQIDSDDKRLVLSMNEKLIHRGPNDCGYYEEKNIAIAHRRLSILDLSEAGHQPMQYQDKYVIVYNGEIYNYIELRENLIKKGYVFRTQTDTEVIMAAYDYYGEECFQKLNGMWALALWDKRKHKLVVSRDRLGVKPLYYYNDGEKMIFASEIKALLCDKTLKRRANDNIVYDYLTQGLLDHTEETFFENIYKFPQASYAIIDESLELRTKRFWKVTFSEKIGESANAAEIKTFRALFNDSVRLRLRSDVAVGSCLSGGLDSSAIVCSVNSILQKRKDQIQQYTFSYQAQDKKLDEIEYMQAVVNETNVHAKFVSPDAENLMEDLDSLIYHQDEPFSTTGMYAGYCVYREAAQENVQVLLDGQGADEILCGYRKSRVYYLGMLKREKKYTKMLKELCLSVSQVKTSLALKSLLKSDVNKVLRILQKDKKRSNVAMEYYNEIFVRDTKGYDYDRRKNFQYNDVFKVSLPALLRYTDRNSMAFSVESRLPFLDYRLVEYCAHLPMAKKIEGGYSKAIMRKALIMPEKVRRRKDKIGFATPEDKWIRQEEKKIKELMSADSFRAKRYINQQKILENWTDIIDNNRIPYFFRLVCLERWMEIFDVE